MWFSYFPAHIYQSSESFYLAAGFTREVLQRKHTPPGAELAFFFFFFFHKKGDLAHETFQI